MDIERELAKAYADFEGRPTAPENSGLQNVILHYEHLALYGNA
jgi:hypothetical protein